MPTEFLSPCADELTPDQRRERIAAILARAVLRQMAVMRMSSEPSLDETTSIAKASPTLKLVAPTRPSVR
jgi:hypothetical protein